MTRGQLRLLRSLSYLTELHGPRTFEDLAAASGRDRRKVARDVVWLVINGYVSVDRDKVLTRNESGVGIGGGRST